MSSYKRKANVYLRTPGTPLELRLIDHRFQTVATGIGELRKKVPPGIYQIEVRAGNTKQREFIELKPGQYFEKTDLHLAFETTAPVPRAANSHEFHGYPAQDISRNPNQSYGDGGRLVLIFRDTTSEGRSWLDISSYTLLNSALEPVGNLQTDTQKIDDAGFIALSADVSPGGYVLRNTLEWDSTAKRSANESPGGADLPIWIEEDWTTIVFIPGSRYRAVPLLRGASIHMARIWMGYSYDNGSDINTAVELTLSGLREGRTVISPEYLNAMLNAKYENPMLGIIGAQAMLLEPRPRWRLFDTVRRNLQKLIPNHPDVTALFVVGKGRRGNIARSRVAPVEFPPMMYAAYRGLIARDADEPGLIVGNSLADQAASRLYRQSPWSLWKPFEFSAETELDPELLENIAEVESMLLNPETPLVGDVARIWENVTAKTSAVGNLSDPEVEHVTKFVQQYSRQSQRGYSRKTPRSAVRIQDLSKQIGLPVSSVVRAIQTISEKGFGKNV